MSSEIFSRIFTRSIKVGVLVSIVLFSFSLSVVAFEEWVPCDPYTRQVELSYWEEAGISYVNVLIEFPSSGYNVSNWGIPRIDGNTISVDAEIWDWTGFDAQVVTYISNDYNLKNLPAGKYLFVFGAWESPVKSMSFTVSGGYLEVDLPFLATHMEDFYGEMVKTNGTVKFYASIYMYEDFWLEAHTGENILVVVRFAELPIPLEDSYIEVQGIIEYCELEGGFFYLNASSWYSALLPTSIYIDPGVITVTSDEEFTVNIEIADVVDLISWEVWISFDPTVLECIDVVEGPFLRSKTSTYFIAYPNNVTGLAMFGCLVCSLSPWPGVTGSGTLATVIFHYIGEGDTDLHLQNTQLIDFVDGKERLIPHNAVDGFVRQLLPTISFFPHEIYLDEQTRNFTVSVNIENLQASHRLGSVSVRLEYDPTLVSFVGDIRGDFLEDFDRYFLIEMDFPYIWLVNTPPVTGFPEGSGTIWLCSFAAPVLVDTTIRLIGEAVDVEGNVLIQNSSDYCHLIVAEQPEPLPTISFSPNEVYLDEQTRNFTVNVNIENLQASHRFVGIGLQIEYDSTALSFVETIEGEFLKDFPQIIPLDTEWYGTLLLPPWTRFPEGNGTLVAFSLTVSGLLNSTMHLSGHFSDADADAFDLQKIHCDVLSTWNRADLNYDGRVNVLDLPVFAEAFATRPGQYGWNTNVDMDRNQVINIIDAAMIAKNFGKSAT